MLRRGIFPLIVALLAADSTARTNPSVLRPDGADGPEPDPSRGAQDLRRPGPDLRRPDLRRPATVEEAVEVALGPAVDAKDAQARAAWILRKLREEPRGSRTEGEVAASVLRGLESQLPQGWEILPGVGYTYEVLPFAYREEHPLEAAPSPEAARRLAWIGAWGRVRAQAQANRALARRRPGRARHRPPRVEEAAGDGAREGPP